MNDVERLHPLFAFVKIPILKSKLIHRTDYWYAMQRDKIRFANYTRYALKKAAFAFKRTLLHLK